MKRLTALVLSLLLLLFCACGKTAPSGGTGDAGSAQNAPGTGTDAPETETDVPETETDVPEAETDAPETETPVTDVPEGGNTGSDGFFVISDDELRDRILGGWIGSMIGVAWGASTEFGWCGRIIPADSMPRWESAMINSAFSQDDLYVEIPFMDAMAEKGVNCSADFMAEKFRDTAFPLWHANMQGRKNLLDGLMPPDSGSYLYNVHADDIDWQIECDFLGMMYPALVNACALRSFDVGHIMNYGDGVYGGVFIAAMHAAAYYAGSVEEIVEAGLSVVPENTKFRALIEDVLASWRAGDSWEENWQKLEDKWAKDDKCPEGQAGSLNIDAKLNSGYVAIGLLYGGGDLADTVVISTRCGQDSDCNPSSAASILGNMTGLSGIDEIYKKDLDWDGRRFSNTLYTFRDVAELSVKQTEEVLTLAGAVHENGMWHIPKDTAAEPTPFEQWPDGMSAVLEVSGGAGNRAAVKLSVYDFGEKPVSVTYDMGDGFTFTDTQPLAYTYEKPGTYTVRCTVKGEAGTEINLEKTVEVYEALALPMTAVCTVMRPAGGGSSDPNTMCDGVVPEEGNAESSLQYDTYDGGGKKTFIFAGVRFGVEATISGVRFTEGKHFWDGGWFSGEPWIEIYEGGVWKNVPASIDREYPGDSDVEQGKSFETYTFTFERPVRCGGVRVSGKPGGQAYFISVGEIAPIVEEIHGDAEEGSADDAIIVCSVAAPTGGGSKDIRVIADGEIPAAAKAADTMQYDTYHGGSPDEEVYVGYLYRTPREVKEIVFSEGNHFWDGGWFKNGAPEVQVYLDGSWQTRECAAEPSYPVSDAKNSFGAGYETYVFRLNEPVLCQGVRLIGTAGGEHGFISVSELEVR